MPPDTGGLTAREWVMRYVYDNMDALVIEWDEDDSESETIEITGITFPEEL